MAHITAEQVRVILLQSSIVSTGQGDALRLADYEEIASAINHQIEQNALDDFERSH